MKIQNTTTQDYKMHPQNQPSFKAGALALNMSGATMQWIENGGFLTSFLIQDGLGMTLPRTIAGFLRDKEVTGHYNIQEGKEVLGRESLTGPCMMAVAPLGLLLAAKFGHSTSINSELIKIFGNNLKEYLENPKFEKLLLKDPEKFKHEFYKINIEKMLEQTLGKDNASKESVDYVMKQLANYEKIPKDVQLKRFRGKAKYRKECINNIVEHINNIKYNTNTDLEMLQKVKLGAGGKTFATKDVVDGMLKYTHDAITANKYLEKLNSELADSIKHKSLAKRMITNISLMAATLGVLSILPKIYAHSNIAPGARKHQEKDNSNSINFKGKNKSFSLLEKLGQKIDKIKSSFVSSELEYNGHNFTHTLMAGLSIFGLLAPRGLRAYNRAQVDENGKKDLTELYEIFVRDLTSSLAVVFAVPMLTRAAVTMYEKHTGFVLMHKARNNNIFKTALDLLNPYSKSHVLTNSEINSLYDKIDSKTKMVNFCKYIDNNGGDLQKILSKSHNSSVLAKENFDLSAMKNLRKADKNKKITEFFEKLNSKKADDIIKTLMKNAPKAKNNKITAFARGLNSIPGVLTTFFISPYILGWFIPRLTYKNTRRIHEKQDREREAINAQKLKTNA